MRRELIPLYRRIGRLQPILAGCTSEGRAITLPVGQLTSTTSKGELVGRREAVNHGVPAPPRDCGSRPAQQQVVRRAQPREQFLLTCPNATAQSGLSATWPGQPAASVGINKTCELGYASSRKLRRDFRGVTARLFVSAGWQAGRHRNTGPDVRKLRIVCHNETG